MRKIYVSHKYQGKKQNKEAISHICRNLVKMGVMPISPVHAFGFLNDNVTEERARAMEFCDSLVEVVDEIWFFGEWWKSEGCILEMIKAAKGKQTIRVVNGWNEDRPIFRMGDEPEWWKS